MNGWFFFLLGLLFTVPLNIASQYLMGPLQRWLDASRASLSGRRKRQLKDELWRVKVYRDDPAMLHTYLLRTIVFILTSFVTFALFCVTVAMVTSMLVLDGLYPSLFGFDIRNPSKTTVSNLLLTVVVASLLALLLLTLMRQAATRALITVRRVSTFSEFEGKTLELLGKDVAPENSDGTNHEP